MGRNEPEAGGGLDETEVGEKRLTESWVQAHADVIGDQ